MTTEITPLRSKMNAGAVAAVDSADSPISAQAGDGGPAHGLCNLLHATGKQVVLFMHSYPTKSNGWRPIFDDQIATLRSSVLAQCGLTVYLGLPQGTPWPFDGDAAAQPPPSILPTTPSPRNAGSSKYEEVNTLSSLYEYCVEHPNDLVAYIHDKGTRKAKPDPVRTQGQWDWRKLHEYFLLEVPQRCIMELVLGRYDMCGVGWKEKPHPHYRGNFWWATCAHVSSLRHMMDFKIPSPWHLDWSPEMWIGSERLHARGGGGKGKEGKGAQLQRGRPLNCFSSNIDHYRHPFPRKLYEGKLCAPDVPLPQQ
jgi:hypothetical protein